MNSNFFGRLWSQIDKKRRMQFILLLGLMLVVSFAEVISIGAVIPFLGLLTSPETLFENNWFRNLIGTLNISQSNELLLPLTLVFCTAAILAGGMRILLLHLATRLSYSVGAELSLAIYKKTLHQPYKVHISTNSSEIINGVTNQTNKLIGFINGALAALSSILILIAVLSALIVINPIVALSTFIGFALIYILIIRFTRYKLILNSVQEAKNSNEVIKVLQEGLGGIRDILIDGSQNSFCDIYQNVDIPLRKAQGSSQFLVLSPRYAMEALGMVLIASIAYLLTSNGERAADSIVILGALALGAQRMLPVLQLIYSSWTGIKASEASLDNALRMLEQPLPNYLNQNIQAIEFKKFISLHNVSFQYGNDSSSVLKNIYIDIPKGSRIGLIGQTGSGKSTLMDILMGLLEPTKGAFKVDGVEITQRNFRAWQSHVAHVPQMIYLADATIYENIAFGTPVESIDYERVILAANQAKISEFIESLPEGYHTRVGERGARLSGGQRQRIGVARALYKRADVIFFDEATSALDVETEEAVIKSIYAMDEEITIFVVAHRYSTLKNCEIIYKIKNGKLILVNDFENK